MMDDEELWENLVGQHKNFAITFNGHLFSGLGRLTSQAPGERNVHQLTGQHEPQRY